MKNPVALAKAIATTGQSAPDKAKLEARGAVFSVEAAALEYLKLLE